MALQLCPALRKSGGGLLDFPGEVLLLGLVGPLQARAESELGILDLDLEVLLLFGVCPLQALAFVTPASGALASEMFSHLAPLARRR